MSDHTRRRRGDHQAPEASPIQRSARAGGGATTRSLPPRPSRALPPAIPAIQLRAAPGASLDATERATEPARAAEPLHDRFSLIAGVDWDATVARRDPGADWDAPVQRRGTGAAAVDAADIQASAGAGVSGPSSPLPHLDAIQQSFGDHDVRGVQAHVGGPAAQAAAQMGAQAYATGNQVAFAASPDLHLTAHEAAHVVQQRTGVSLKGGVGQAGDTYEQHADAVADAVVRGESAAPLLAHLTGPGPAGFSATANAAIQRKGASEGQLGVAATNLAAPSPEVQALNTALVGLESAETDAQNLLAQVTSGTLTHDRAYGRLTTIMASMVGPLAQFGKAQRSTSPGQQRPRDASSNWFGDDEATSGEQGQQEALDRWRPRVLDALTNVARVALLLRAREQAAGGDLTLPTRKATGLVAADSANDRVGMDSMVSALASVGAGLGWTPPATVADADARRYAHEACPTGAREDRPDHCNLPDNERVELRRLVVDAAERAIEKFIKVCGGRKAQLEAIVAKTAAGRELILGIATDAIKAGISALTAGTGGKLLEFAMDVGYTLGEAQLERPGAKDPIREADSVNMLDSLEAAVIVKVRELGEHTNALDDRELREVRGALESLSEADFERKLVPFIAAYQAQIEPIGHTGPRFEDKKYGAKYQSVWAIAGERRRLALVVDQAHTSNGPPLPLRERTTSHEYRFERWIDPQFEAAVDSDAAEVPAETIAEIPMMWVAGVSP